MEERVLAIEDEEPWQQNYRRWIRDDLCGAGTVVKLDIVENPADAVQRLRERYYSAVIVDLVLRKEDEADRGGNAVQEFLYTRREGTVHVVVSARAEKEDVRRAAYHYGANAVLFKPELEDPSTLRDAVVQAIESSRKKRPDFNGNSLRLLVGSGVGQQLLESQLLAILRPSEGINGWFHILEKWLLPRIFPIVRHLTRRSLEITGKTAVGLVWSRRLGKAISFSMASLTVPRSEQTGEMSKWLGVELGETISSTELSGIRALVWEHPDLTAEYFDIDGSSAVKIAPSSDKH